MQVFCFLQVIFRYIINGQKVHCSGIGGIGPVFLHVQYDGGSRSVLRVLLYHGNIHTVLIQTFQHYLTEFIPSYPANESNLCSQAGNITGKNGRRAPERQGHLAGQVERSLQLSPTMAA